MIDLCLRGMLQRDHGIIVSFSTLLAIRPMAMCGQASYSAAKVRPNIDPLFYFPIKIDTLNQKQI
jgi:hypothetical protein